MRSISLSLVGTSRDCISMPSSSQAESRARRNDPTSFMRTGIFNGGAPGTKIEDIINTCRTETQFLRPNTTPTTANFDVPLSRYPTHFGRAVRRPGALAPHELRKKSGSARTWNAAGPGELAWGSWAAGKLEPGSSPKVLRRPSKDGPRLGRYPARRGAGDGGRGQLLGQGDGRDLALPERAWRPVPIATKGTNRH